MKRFLIRAWRAALLCLLSALLLAGCANLSDKMDQYRNRDESMTNLNGDVWQYRAVWPWEDNPVRLREHMYEQARWKCGDQKLGAQMIECASAKRKSGPGTEAVLIFRCVRSLANTTSGKQKRSKI